MTTRLPILPAPFERIAIVGLGLVGGSIALACRGRWPSALVIAVDRKDVLEDAMRRHVVDVAADDLHVAAEADLIVLAAPVGEIVRLLPQLAGAIPGAAVVTDTGSTKRAIVRAAAALPSRLTFVGGHPMGGAAASGLAHAGVDLFKERPWIFTPTAETPSAALDRLTMFATALGAQPTTMSAEEHDRVLAAVSHLPQIVASALMAVAGERAGEAGLAMAGNGLRDTTRLASSPASMWAGVLASNADEVGPALDAMIEQLRRLRDGLGDRAAVARLFDAASGWRARLKV